MGFGFFTCTNATTAVLGRLALVVCLCKMYHYNPCDVTINTGAVVDSTKYQVFISSTYKDLEIERESIIKAILEMYHIPIGMEMFSAEDEEQWEIIRRTIEVSDYYILILGLRYGSKTSEGISFTQKEYEYALEKKIPILAFVMDEGAALPRDKRDDDLTDINRFRSMVLKNSKMSQFWESKDQLIKNVSISLMKQIMQKPGIGWVRGDKIGKEEELSKELANLSKENRVLREQVAELQSKASSKEPNIDVKLYPANLNLDISRFKPLSMPKKFHADDAPDYLRPFLDSEEINRFNNSLPTEAQLQQYNEEKEKYFIAQNFSSPLVIDVSNLGTCKANNIYVDITFPEDIFVYKNNKAPEQPERPMSASPLEGAEKRYENFQRPNRFIGSIGRQPFGLSNIDEITKGIKPVNDRWWTSLNGNRLTITINNLLHTRQITFDDEYSVAPLKPGLHNVEVHVICEEYNQEVVSTFTLDVK